MFCGSVAYEPWDTDMAELDTYERQLRYWGADTQLGRWQGSGILSLSVSFMKLILLLCLIIFNV